MKTITRIWAVGAAVSLTAITGCAGQGGEPPAAPAADSSSGPSSTASAQAEGAVITIKDFKYDVPESVKPVSMVTVTNADSAPHTLTVKDKGGFDIEVPGGATATFRAPDAPGEYGIICSFHPQMTGTLVVK